MTETATLDEIQAAEAFHTEQVKVVPNDPYTAMISLAMQVIEARIGRPYWLTETVQDPLSHQREVKHVTRRCEEMAWFILSTEWEPSCKFKHTKAVLTESLKPSIGRRCAETLL